MLYLLLDLSFVLQSHLLTVTTFTHFWIGVIISRVAAVTLLFYYRLANLRQLIGAQFQRYRHQ